MERKTHFLLHFPFSNVSVYLYRLIPSVGTVSINKFAYSYSFNKKTASIDDTYLTLRKNAKITLVNFLIMNCLISVFKIDWNFNSYDFTQLYMHRYELWNISFEKMNYFAIAEG